MYQTRLHGETVNDEELADKEGKLQGTLVCSEKALFVLP